MDFTRQRLDGAGLHFYILTLANTLSLDIIQLAPGSSSHALNSLPPHYSTEAI